MGTAVVTEGVSLDWGSENPAAPPVVSGLGVQAVKAGGSPVLNKTLSIAVPSFNPGPSDTTPGVAAGPFTSFAPGATTVKAGGSLVLLEGDKSAQVMVTWANAPPNVPTSVRPVICTLQSAGQSEVTAV
jgi:hypothetical protein